WMRPAKRADVYDSSPRSPQVRVRGTSDEKRRSCIGCEDPIPLLDGDLFQTSGLKHPRIVDHEIKTPELRHNLSDGRATTLWIAKITSDRQHIDIEGGEFAHRLFSLLLRGEIGNRNICSLLCKRQRNSSPNSFGRPGDKRGFACKQLRRGVSHSEV